MAALAASGCANGSVAPTVPAGPPPATLDQKIAWTLRLEQERVLRDPEQPAGAAASPETMAPPGNRPPAAPPPGTPAPGFTPAEAADLTALARDPSAAVRGRAMLAIGRVGMDEGLPVLEQGLGDVDPGVRASAAFALGLTGVKSAVPKLEQALADPAPAVRPRAADALGLIGDPSAAAAVAQSAAGCAPLLAAVAPDNEDWPLALDLDLCRSALFALVRLGNYDALAHVALDAQGHPVSRWWPVAYALQRSGDRRAATALLDLATTPGVDTAGFALRGLAALGEARAAPFARAIVRRPDADVKLRVAAVRVLGRVGNAGDVSLLAGLLSDPATTDPLALEVTTALGALHQAAAFDVLADLIGDPDPAMRATALAAAAKADPDAFLLLLAGLGRDADWTVRAALASVLGTLPADRVTVALEQLADDENARVHGPALDALVAVKAPGIEARLLASLEAPDFVERATAARLVGKVHPAGGEAALVAAYTRGESDTAYAARAAALDALATYGGPDAIATLRRGLADREWPVRVKAADLLHGLGQADAEPERPAPLRHPNSFFSSAELLHPAFSPRAYIETAQGVIQVALNVVDAPVTTRTFIEQARSGFFNGMKIHRVVPTFVVQAGDSRGDGEGGPGYTLRDELSDLPYLRGTMGMALDGPDTAGSQWFITLSPQPHLDGRYTAFGQVADGWDVLDRLSPWDEITRIRIWDGVEFR